MNYDLKPQICKEPKKLAELGVQNFFGDFNARNSIDFQKNLNKAWDDFVCRDVILQATL